MTRRHLHRIRLAAGFALAALLCASTAQAFQVTGTWLYEDRLWDKDGYTGQTQQLPVRNARVEVVDAVTQLVLASGVTDGDGDFDVEVTGQAGVVNLFVRVLTDGADAGYHIVVVDELVRDFVNGQLVLGNTHAVGTSVTAGHDPAGDLDVGAWLIQDPDGTGVAQAFNILDNAVDFFDWMDQPGRLGRLPDPSEFVAFAWSPTGANEGSNYQLQGILISSPGQGNDTDGWSDTVILHEQGHWFDDVFSNSDNPGGAHFLGDNFQDPRLSYGEGVATFHCAKVRQWRQGRLNSLGNPVDDHVSYYADLQIPPAIPNPGGLSFSYDFEHGTLNDGTPFGQAGTANETNVTSVLWDLVDGPGSADESPGIDDDTMGVSDDLAWAIETAYLTGLPDGNPVTVEDYYEGWFATHGAGFLQAEMDLVFITLNRMAFHEDADEPDDTPATAGSVTPLPHAAGPGGAVVINEVDPGVQDAVELYNSADTAADLTGWQIEVYVNGVVNDASRIYTFPPFTLQPGETVTVFERGDPLDDGQYHLYAGETPMAFNASWFHGGDGACVLRDDLGNNVDFVRWRDAGGVDNTTPTPPGTGWSGLLDSPASPRDLGRDIDGTDTDSAADWSAVAATLSGANHPAPRYHTLFGTGDADVISFSATANTRYGFEARGTLSATDTRIEILSPAGDVLGSNDAMDPSVANARLDFFAPTTDTYHVRVTHTGPYTDWGEYDLLAFVRPVADVFAPPVSMSAEAENLSDTADQVQLQWLNAAIYDSVLVYRDGLLHQVLPGSPGSSVDAADRGLYRYEVSGVIDGEETGRVSAYEFAGRVGCSASDDFETGSAGLWITGDGPWDVTPFAESGTWGFTDSPAGTYQGCPAGAGGCTVNAIAVFGVPSLLPPGSILTFDHICITEVDFDFGIVEVSTNDGNDWTEIARYDQGDDPGWGDNVADPTDWRPASLDLSAFAGEEILVRFRLQSDQLIELDGWYLDNVMVNDAGCTPLAADGPAERVALRLHPPAPNPMRSLASLAFTLPSDSEVVRMEVFDVTGRRARSEDLGRRAAGDYRWTWDGRDDSGREVSAGMYYVRLRTAAGDVTRKLVKIAR